MARKALKNVCRLLDDIQQELPVEKSFVADLKRSIELTANKCVTTPSKTYKPSSMQCLRNMYYQVTGVVPDELTASAILIGICESGTDRHERIQNAVMQMKENGIDCEYIDVTEFVKLRNLDNLDVKCKSGNETKLYHKTLNLSFLCDGIIRYKGHYYVLEIKTESLYKWQNRQGVADEHKMQGTAYATVFGLNEVIFLYINRDNTDMKAYLFPVTDDMKHDFIGRIEECDNYVKCLKVPPKPLDISKKTCEYCSYKNSCRKDGV